MATWSVAVALFLAAAPACKRQEPPGQLERTVTSTVARGAEHAQRQSKLVALAQNEGAPAPAQPGAGREPQEAEEAQPPAKTGEPEQAQEPAEEARGGPENLPQAEQSAEPAPDAAVGATTATGYVQRATAEELVMTQAGQSDLRVKVEPGTPVTVDGQDGEITDLAAGTPVRVVYRMVADQPIANRIDSMPQPIREEPQPPR